MSSNTTDQRAEHLALLASLREQLADAVRELRNPRLFKIARETIAARIKRQQMALAALADELGETP